MYLCYFILTNDTNNFQRVQNLNKMKRTRAFAFLAAFHPRAGNKHIKKCVDKYVQRKIVSYIDESEDDVPYQMCEWAQCIKTRRHKSNRYWFCSEPCKTLFYSRCCKCFDKVEESEGDQYHPIMETVYKTGNGVICNKCLICRMCGKTPLDKIIVCPKFKNLKILDCGWVCSEKCKDEFEKYWNREGKHLVEQSAYGCAYWVE